MIFVLHFGREQWWNLSIAWLSTGLLTNWNTLKCFFSNLAKCKCIQTCLHLSWTSTYISYNIWFASPKRPEAMEKRWGSKHGASGRNIFPEWHTESYPWEESNVFQMLHRDPVLKTGLIYDWGVLGAHLLLFWCSTHWWQCRETSPSVTTCERRHQICCFQETQSRNHSSIGNCLAPWLPCWEMPGSGIPLAFYLPCDFSVFICRLS